MQEVVGASAKKLRHTRKTGLCKGKVLGSTGPAPSTQYALSKGQLK